MAEPINIYQAKTHLSHLVSRAESGEEITLSRNGRPVARLVPLVPNRVERRPGFWRGRVEIAPSFDEFSVADEGEWHGR